MSQTNLIDHTAVFWISAIGVLLQVSVILYNVWYKQSDLQITGTPIALAIISWNLKLVHIASLATCIPIGLDVLLDIFSKEKIGLNKLTNSVLDLPITIQNFEELFAQYIA